MLAQEEIKAIINSPRKEVYFAQKNPKVIVVNIPGEVGKLELDLDRLTDFLYEALRYYADDGSRTYDKVIYTMEDLG